VALGRRNSRWTLERAVMTGAEAEQHAFLTKKEAAEFARLGVRTLEQAMHDGELEYLGGGPRRLAVQIRPEWVEDWLRRRRGDG
jgi:hypothetical protein